MNTPRVSAIIIVFNGETYLAEAIDSVLAQEFGDWELLVVDDGSTDRSRDIVNSYLGAHPERVRLLRHPDNGNHGMSATRNVGIAAARGEFIAFLDADDVWLPAKLSEQVHLFDSHPKAALVYGRTLIWNEWDPRSGKKDYFYSLGVEPDALHEPPRLFFQLLENVHQTPTTCNAMMRRDAMLEVGGFDPTFRDMFEDQIFFAKLLLAYPAYVSGKCWAKYRRHGAAASSQAARKVRQAHLRYLRALRRYLVQWGDGLSRPRLAVERTIAKLHGKHIMGGVRRRLLSFTGQ
jgi:glycosyltransferase involved in cell wall biosynthesis